MMKIKERHKFYKANVRDVATFSYTMNNDYLR